MTQQTLKQALNTFNLLLVATFLVLALYSALGQQVFPFIGQYRVSLESYISQRIQSPVEIRSLTGDMHILTPSVHVEGISMGDSSSPILSIAAVDAVLDPRLSLLNLTPVFKSVRLSGVSIRIDQSLDKKQSTDKSEETADAVRRFVESLLLQQHLELNNVTIDFPFEGDMQTLVLDHLVMTGDGFSRLMTGNVSYGHENTIKTGFRLFTQGNPYELESFYARGYMDLPLLDVNFWLEELLQLAVFEEFESSSKLNFEFKDGLLNYAKLSASSPKVEINKNKSFENVKSEIWLKQNNVDTWSLWLGKGQFTLNNVDWQLNDVAIKVSRTLQGNRWQGFLQDMDLEYVQGLLSALDVVPDSVKDILAEIDGSGSLKNFSIILQQQGQQSPQITLAGELDNVSVNEYLGIPKLENVSGVLAANKHSGRIQLNGNNTRLHLSSLYEQPFHIEQAQGQVDWFIGEHQTHVSGKGLNLQTKDIGKVKGGFQIWAPKTLVSDTAIELNLSFENVDLLANQALIPSQTIPSLKGWLDQNIKYGNVKDGLFYLYSDLSKTQSLSQLQLYLDVDNSALSYMDKWPQINNVSGQMFVDNDVFLANINTANTLGGDVNQLQIIYEQDNLWLSGGLVGDSKSLFSYFKSTPLRNSINGQFDNWEFDGRHFTELAIKAPIAGDDEIAVQVKSGLRQTHMHMTDLNLAFNYINGQVFYSTSQGLKAQGITANFWQRPFTVDISSQVQDKEFKTDIEFNGSVEASSLKDWLQLSLLAPISGQAVINGHFIIDSRSDGFTGLKLGSSLEGIKVDLPVPFGKKAKDTMPFDSQLQIKEGQVFSLSYGERANLVMKLEQGKFMSGQVNTFNEIPQLPSDPGFFVNVKTDSISIDDWLSVWQNIEKEKSKLPPTPGGNEVLKSVSINTKHLHYQKQRFENVNAIMLASGAGWDINVDAPLAKGLVGWQPNAPLKLDLDYFHWPAIEESHTADSNAEKIENKHSDPLAWLNPVDIPALDLSVDEIFIGPTNYGSWNMLVEPLANGVKLSNVDGVIKKLSVKGNAHWVKSSNSRSAVNRSEFTEANLSLASSDLAGIQAAWRNKPVVEAKRTNAQININWPASPAAFDIEKAKGDISVHLKDGRFLDAGGADALGAFGILNFAAIGRRLRLDFTDVYESGFHFDDVKGKAKIADGIIEIVDTIQIEGPSAKFAASGTVNTANKQLNQELSVTFPVSSSLPFVAILAGLAPPVAASLFVGERLVGDELERFTSATYKLTGTWDDPDLKLKKRFDNDIEGKKDKTFWHRMKDVFGVGD